MTDPKITSMPCWCWHTVQRKLFSWILEFALQAVLTGSKYCHSVLKRLISISTVSCERGLAFRGEDRQYRVSWKWKLIWYARTPCPVWRFPKPAHPEARKARKPSLQTKNIHSHNTRNKNGYLIPNVRTNCRKFTVSYAGPILWNSFPQKLRQLPSEVLFKRKLKYILLATYWEILHYIKE